MKPQNTQADIASPARREKDEGGREKRGNIDDLACRGYLTIELAFLRSQDVARRVSTRSGSQSIIKREAP